MQSYRPLPFWSWNDRLDTNKLIEQIHWMHRNGIGGFFMHARSGLQTEYMSEEWMECIEGCEEEANRLGMKAWLYDENGWPSGFAGGKLLEDEENRDCYITHQKGLYDSQATVSYLLTEEELVRVADGEANGEYLNLYIHTSASTADILNPDVVRKFLNLTHEKYKERYGDAFSERIEGFFTDEPQYYRWSTPYTNVIGQYFQKEYQEDILDSLGLLFVEKKGYRDFRYRYWKTMQKLMLESFAKQLYTWCDTNGVKLTGHYLEEATIGGQMMCCGGIMPFYEYEHIPGIDWLGNIADTELPIKQVESAATQLGKKQILTEAFGCCGWDVSPAELRRILSFQYVNGVNLLCHHLLPYSERGNRKYDHPAHYSDINPWVREEFKSFNDYYTRLGYSLGEGEKHINVAVLHPLRSAYFDYQRELEEKGFGVRELDESLVKSLRLLSARGIEYHLLDETLLAKHGFVSDNQIGCGLCSYDYLVIPPILTMDKTTEVLLGKYVAGGGKVLLLGRKPKFLEAKRYAYDYLETNVTMEEIMDAQPYRVDDYETAIYSTYRTKDGRAYLYVMNQSADKVQTQTFRFGSDIKSFSRCNLTDMSEQLVPLTITLHPGEDAFLYPSEKQPDKAKGLVPYQFFFRDADVQFSENSMPVDYIRYSLDGKEFSEPWPCPALFQKLLKDKYEGKIFFRYEFDVEVMPEQIFIQAETNREKRAWFNGIELTDKVVEDYTNIYNITSLVRGGCNEYTVEVDWHEDEAVYYALFGENVTESLKNCIVYDSELQPIYLVGKFGVYSKTGYHDTEPQFVEAKKFYIGGVPEKVTDITVDGFPFFAGEVVLTQEVMLEQRNVLLQIAGEYQIAEVIVNGVNMGTLLFDKELDISDVAVEGMNKIQVRFLISNRNLLGPHHFTEEKRGNVSPFNFEMSGTWNENQSKWYHDSYDLKLFYCKCNDTH